MKHKLALFSIIIFVVLTLAGYSLTFLPISPASADTLPRTLAPSSTILAAPKLATTSDLENALENIYTQVNPSVVAIQVVQKVQTSVPTFPRIPGSPFFGSPNQQGPQTQVQHAAGSGFVWDLAGHIITNNHVVDGANKISVIFYDGTTVSAKIVGTDPDSDLAVIQVDPSAFELHPVQMGDSNQIKVGQLAIAIGNPFSEQNTMTTGIISALERTLPTSNNSALGPSYTIPDIIQTDAPINPGNSGGVLLNIQGEVVGVTAAIESSTNSSSGIGFAIPSAIVQKVVPALIKTGHFDHTYIGISGTTLTPSVNQEMGLKANQRGALVVDVSPSSPAEKAGLRGSTRQATIDGQVISVGGDVITAIDNQPIKTFDDLVSYLARSTQINQTVTLTVIRDGKELSVKATLAARPGAQVLLNNP